MKPIIYPIAIVAGVFASFNTMNLVFSLNNTTATQVIVKVKHKIMNESQTTDSMKNLCKTEIKRDRKDIQTLFT